MKNETHENWDGRREYYDSLQRDALRRALVAILPYREHNWDCESRMTEFCTCGMKQAADAAKLILNQTAALVEGKQASESPTNG